MSRIGGSKGTPLTPVGAVRAVEGDRLDGVRRTVMVFIRGADEAALFVIQVIGGLREVVGDPRHPSGQVVVPVHIAIVSAHVVGLGAVRAHKGPASANNSPMTSAPASTCTLITPFDFAIPFSPSRSELRGNSTALYPELPPLHPG